MTNQPARARDWQSRLEAFISERSSMPFAWAANDCCSFVFDACVAMSGHDPLAPYRTYSNELQAQRILSRLGGVRALAALVCGPEIPPALAQVGDVGLVDLGGRESLVLCTGGGWTGPGESGLVRMPAELATAAWRALPCHS